MVGIRDRRKQETRARIVRVAAELFATRGIDAVTVDEIASAAEVGKGTIYNYFRVKEDVVAAFLLDLERAAFARVEDLPREGMTAAEALDAFAWGLLEAKSAHHAFVRAFMARLFSGPDMTEALAAFHAEMDRILGTLFCALQARGAVSSRRGTEDLILAFKTLHLGLSALWAMEGPPFVTSRRMTRLHTETFAKGISDD